MKWARVAAASILILPLLAAAQTDLRSQIRADLAADPRTAEMSEAEMDALVEALATEAESSGAAEEYIDGKNVPDYASQFAASQPVQVGGGVSPMQFAISFLVLVLMAIAFYVLDHRRSAPDDDLSQ
jgi:hypothetical protein